MKNNTISVAYRQFMVSFLALLLLGGCQMSERSELKTVANTVEKQVIKVKMNTALGVVEIELYRSLAPKTVDNFLRYVDSDSYSGGNFYRVVRDDNDRGSPKIRVIQGDVADPERQFAPVVFESTEKTGIKHLDGTLSMARLGPDTATSSFFICIGPQPSLDFGGLRASDKQGFAAFGRVVKGMSIIKQINQIRQSKASKEAYFSGQMLLEPVLIHSISRM